MSQAKLQWVFLLCLPTTALAGGTVTGQGQMERVKGQPQLGHLSLYEVNLFVSPPGPGMAAATRRLGAPAGGPTYDGYFTAELPAGTYSLFTTPGPETWTFHFNSALGLSGAFARNPETGKFENAYKAENDVVTASVAPGTIEEEVDQLTFSFEEVEGGAHMVLRWITTEVRLAVKPAS